MRKPVGVEYQCIWVKTNFVIEPILLCHYVLLHNQPPIFTFDNIKHALWIPVHRKIHQQSACFSYLGYEWWIWFICLRGLPNPKCNLHYTSLWSYYVSDNPWLDNILFSGRAIILKWGMAFWEIHDITIHIWFIEKHMMKSYLEHGSTLTLIVLLVLVYKIDKKKYKIEQKQRCDREIIFFLIQLSSKPWMITRLILSSSQFSCWDWAKSMTFCEWHLQTHFLERKCILIPLSPKLVS